MPTFGIQLGPDHRWPLWQLNNAMDVPRGAQHRDRSHCSATPYAIYLQLGIGAVQEIGADGHIRPGTFVSSLSPKTSHFVLRTDLICPQCRHHKRHPALLHPPRRHDRRHLHNLDAYHVECPGTVPSHHSRLHPPPPPAARREIHIDGHREAGTADHEIPSRDAEARPALQPFGGRDLYHAAGRQRAAAGTGVHSL